MSRTNATSGAFFAASLLLLGACASADEDTWPDAAESNFSVMPMTERLSILPAIEKSDGKPEVCVGLIGFPQEDESETLSMVIALMTDAANQWNALLKDYPLWFFHGDIAPVFAGQRGACTATNQKGFNINIWAKPAQFKKDFCTSQGLPVSGCSSAAIPQKRTMFLGPWNRTVEQDPLDSFVMLHEYGHLLGLGDTYRVPGVNDWKGEQPPSVMNGESVELTDDDKLGLWVAVRGLKNGTRSCDGYGDKVKMTANGFSAVMCNPTAEAIQTHGIAANQTGPTPEDKAKCVGLTPKALDLEAATADRIAAVHEKAGATVKKSTQAEGKVALVITAGAKLELSGLSEEDAKIVSDSYTSVGAKVEQSGSGTDVKLVITTSCTAS
jgi:hypothetical protein